MGRTATMPFFVFIVGVLLLCLVGLVVHGQETAVNSGLCPFDGTPAQWTGRTELRNNETWYIMKCVKGDEYLSRSP